MPIQILNEAAMRDNTLDDTVPETVEAIDARLVEIEQDYEAAHLRIEMWFDDIKSRLERKRAQLRGGR